MAIADRTITKKSATHIKRHGQHQKRSQHFMKAYWPYLPMAAIVGIGMLFNSLWIQPKVLGYATNMSPTGLLNNTNDERTKNGLSSLTTNTLLAKAAQAKADDMVARNYWSHNTPDGQEPWIFITNAKYDYLAAGENLAYGFASSQDAVTGWMNSPGHRANILNSDYQEVGFGIANSSSYQNNGEETIVVAMYGKPAAGVESPITNQAPTTAVSSSQPLVADSPSTTNVSDASVNSSMSEGKKIAAVQLTTKGMMPWSLFATSLIAIILLAYLLTRHSIAWHKTLVKKEQFILKHKFLDIVLVATIVLAAILSQTSGFIK